MAGRFARLAVPERGMTDGNRSGRRSDRARDQASPHAGQRAAGRVCELCRRETPHCTVHPLIPRAAGGRFGPTAQLCATCHRQLHALFSEATLAAELHSLPLLEANPQVRRYLKWARRQQGSAGFKVRPARERR